MRSIEEVAAELEKAEIEFDTAKSRLSVLQREMETIRVARADHPWIGKTVCRAVRYGYRNKTKTARGKLVVVGSEGFESVSRLRGVYRPKPGDLIVVTNDGTGSLAYDFYDKQPHLRPGETEWELDQ